MSTPRLVTPVTSSNLFFTYLAAAVSRSCPHAARIASSRGQHSQSSKRDLYTQPAYRPHRLPESFGPPPRNAGIPDTSIAGPKPETDNSRPPRLTGFQEGWANDKGEEVASISFPESEAQKSKPVDIAKGPSSTTVDKSAEQPTPQASEPPKRKRKLRPRKAAMSITPSAIQHLRRLVSQPDPKMIRVGVKNKGCSGLAYDLSYTAKPSPTDEIVEQDGVKVLIDSRALLSIIGSEMDWQEDKLASRFIFKNPNVKEQCGCGESFMV